MGNRIERKAEVPWSRGSRQLDRDQLDRLLNGLLQAAQLAGERNRKGLVKEALAIWHRASSVLREGLEDLLGDGQAEAWGGVPPNQVAVLKKQVQDAFYSMSEAASLLEGFNQKKLERGIHDLFRALHDIVDAQQAHQVPPATFKGSERQDLVIGGVPVVLEHRVGKKDVADKALENLEVVLPRIQQAARRSGAPWLAKLPPVYVSYLRHPSPKSVLLSLDNVAREPPKTLEYKLAILVGEKIYDLAPGGAKADWVSLMRGYWTEFVIQHPANNLDMERLDPRQAFGLAVAGLILHGQNYLDPKVLAGVQAVGRASRVR